MRISALGTINPDLQRTFRNSRTMVLAQKTYQSGPPVESTGHKRKGN
jgi:hypothetical protein